MKINPHKISNQVSLYVKESKSNFYFFSDLFDPFPFEDWIKFILFSPLISDSSSLASAQYGYLHVLLAPSRLKLHLFTSVLQNEQM